MSSLQPTAAEPRPLEDTIGGVRFDDPFRWLEEESAEALEWQQAQDAAAAACLHGWPGYAKLVESLRPRLASQVVYAPHERRGRWFRQDAVGLVVSDEPVGAGRVLVDPGERTLDWWYPSPDGRFVAYGLSEGGDEQSVLRVVETESGRVLPEQMPFTSFGHVAWLPDSSGFYYSGNRAPDPVDAQKHIWFHRLGEPPPDEPEVVPSRVAFLLPQISPDGRWLAQCPSEIESRPDHLLDRETGEWRPFLRDRTGVFVGEFVGDEYVCITTEDAPRGRLVAIPLDAGDDPSRWRELLPESQAVLRHVAVVAGRLVVSSLVDAHSRITIHGLDGAQLAEVRLPDEGAAADHAAWWGQLPIEPLVATASDSFTFAFSNHVRSGAIYRYVLDTGELQQLSEPAIDLSDRVAVRRLETTSTDGEPVRMWVVQRRDLASDPQPTLLYGYGGWNVAFLPVWYGALTTLLDAGCSLAFVNLRGGGEFGWDQWQQGRLLRKQQTFDDLYAAADALVAEGVAARDRLAVAGASNGGLLAAAAVTQRPDLWRVTVPLVPVTDVLRGTRDPFLAQFDEEYGDPADPTFAPLLAAYSPAHNARPGTSYPATLVVCGGDDIRCPAWQGRKLVAALQNANAGEHPVLLRVWPGAAHMTGVLGSAEQTADWLGFVMAGLGLEPA
ncbi:MAG TPA: prolyl oligopeptidase family serine peptidase [Gaiellaceae bacterium]